MMLDHCQRLLGVSESSDPMTLLGLADSDSLDAVRIHSALQERLTQVFAHPDGRSPEAEEVRAMLRSAADQLRQSVRTSGTGAPVRRWGAPPVFNLTPFDRLVLAVLVGSGGWNAQSRAQLVALASANGITVQGLMRVVQGLSDYARAGGARLGVNEITSGNSLAQFMPASPSGSAIGPAILDRLTENLSAELKRDDPWPTIKLSLIFGVATLIVCIVSLRLFFRTAPAPAPPGAGSVAAAATTSMATPTASTARRGVPASDAFAKARLVQYAVRPTFLGSALPPQAIAAASQANDLPRQLDDLARRLLVSASSNPSEAIFRNWEVSIETVATGWPLIDGSTRRRIDRQVLEVLHAAGDRPSVSDRLLGALMPPAPAAINEPLSIWRGAWKAGMLGRIASGGQEASTARHAESPAETSAPPMPPVVAQRAQAMLHAALSAQGDASVNAADRWLLLVMPQLVSRTEINDDIHDFWELWLGAQRALSRGERYDRAIVGAISAILATSTDLSRTPDVPRSTQVLGRLVSIALERPSPVIRVGIEGLFEQEHITTRDLWVLTTLMAMTDSDSPRSPPWFHPRLVVPDDADQRHRERIKAELAAAWPSTAYVEQPSILSVFEIDPELARKWLAAMAAVIGDSATHHQSPTTTHQLRALIAASRLNEAAEAMAVRDVAVATRALETMYEHRTEGLAMDFAATTHTIGHPLGSDGVWAREYQQAGRTVEQRISALRSISHGGDLGPIDAELLVREVYRGSPVEVRTAAQEQVVNLAGGMTVAMAMLDLFSEARASDDLTRVIQEYTGRALPAARAAGWAVAARLALLEHVLQLRERAGVGGSRALGGGGSGLASETDALSRVLMSSYMHRVALARRQSVAMLPTLNDGDGPRLLVQARMDQARSVTGPRGSTPIAMPDSLEGLQRRLATREALAEGPVQHFVAHQLALIDLLAYLTVNEQPEKHEEVTAVLRALRETGRGGPSAPLRGNHVLEQSLHAELAMAALWKLRLRLDEIPTDMSSGGGT